MMHKKIYQLKNKQKKKLKSVGLTHQSHDMGHDIEITIKTANNNKLWSSIFNKTSIERWN